jgi:hypothetical protein
VSGPLRGAGATAAPRGGATASIRGGAVALPLRPVPRRDRAAAPPGSLAGRVGSIAASLPDRAWLDRVVRGRAWIPLLGILLAGIVAMQVEILKLGASMGHALEQTSTLTTQNQLLRQTVAGLADDQRVEKLASTMGLVLPPPGAVGYLAAPPGGNVSGALGNLHSPNPSSFVLLTPRWGDGALVTGPGTSTLPPTPGAPTPTLATTQGTTASAGAAGTGTGTQTGTTATQPTSTATSTAPTGQSPASTSQVASPSQTSATTSSPSSTSQPTGTVSQTPTQSTGASGGQGLATGAAAIQPAGSGQPGGGG